MNLSPVLSPTGDLVIANRLYEIVVGCRAAPV